MKRLYILTLCSILTAACIFFFKKRTPTTIAAGKGLVIPKAWLRVNEKSLTPKADVRPADQTFLTFPEWFLVFSPEEQANYFKQHTATSFPFMSHTAQIWESYQLVNAQIKDNFPTNKGYHFMIWVIGTSASVEYTVKNWYEAVVGRMTDTGKPLTEEDQFTARFAQDYVDFIKERPWYAFDFKSRLKTLWTSTSFFGEHFFRKMERKYILTSELLAKSIYGKCIQLGTQQLYEDAVPTTAVLLENDSLQYLPRYDKFAQAAIGLAKNGHSFREIAGNRSAILLTVLVPKHSHVKFSNAQTVFTQTISYNSTLQRVALAIPVGQLSNLLLQLAGGGTKIEHVFDY